MATIQDVARRAGVSVATVSRVINRAGNVRPDTERRVLEAVHALRYTPNLLGRNLRQGGTRKLLVLLNTFSNQFYSRVVKGVEAAAGARGYVVMAAATHGDPAVEEKYLVLLRTRLIDGVIFLSSEKAGEALARELADYPAVQACEPRRGFPTPRVCIDNEAAGREAALYLIGKGHREIAYFGAPGGEDSPSSRREAGYRRALAEAGIPVREDWVLREGFSVNAGGRAAARLLAAGGLPSAVFCAADSIAAGAIRVFAEHGLSVPADLSVMGFDNTQLSEVFLPSITTTRQPQFEIGQKAAELLCARIEGTLEGLPDLVLPHQIIERNSVAERKP